MSPRETVVSHDPDTLPAHDDRPHGHQVSLEVGLAFVNTLEHERARDLEHLETVAQVLQWFVGHSLMHPEMVTAVRDRLTADPATAERVMTRIHRVRSAIRELADATVERRPPRQRQLDEVNRMLRTPYTYYLVQAPDGVSLDHRHDGDPVEGALARLVESVAREVSQGNPERIRVCANPDCRWVFHDTSRSGRRKWCDMATCGNRAKVARHRERKRRDAADVTDADMVSADPMATDDTDPVGAGVGADA
jgi:predicted RNA-binding Zn ribbon-like protein